MPFTPTLYETHESLPLVRRHWQPETFFTQLCFSNVQTYDTKFIDFDVLEETRKLAPFVAPTAQGRPMREQGVETRIFEPAYIKPKDAVDASRPILQRTAGEPIGGNLTAAERYAIIKQQVVRNHMQSIALRLEWMAVQAMLAGEVTVTGENYPSKTVTFGRADALTIAASDLDAEWTASDADPEGDLENAGQLVLDNSGASITDLVFDQKAWNLLRKNKEFREKLDNRRQDGGVMQLFNQRPKYVQYKGNVGDIDYWVYGGAYKDDAGDLQRFLPDYTVVGVDRESITGIQAYGAIHDPRAGYMPVSHFIKNWMNEDPPAELIMTQTAPLMIPAEPNACFAMTVAAG